MSWFRRGRTVEHRSDRDSRLESIVILPEGMSVESFEICARDPNPAMLVAVASDDRTPPHVLGWLSVNKDREVRAAVIANPNTSLGTLRTMAFTSVGFSSAAMAEYMSRRPATLTEAQQRAYWAIMDHGSLGPIMAPFAMDVAEAASKQMDAETFEVFIGLLGRVGEQVPLDEVAQLAVDTTGKSKAVLRLPIPKVRESKASRHRRI